MSSNGSRAITFRVGKGHLAEQLEARDYPHESHANELARRDLGRYYEVLARSLATVQLSKAEASALCDANNGTAWDNWSISLLWANVADCPGLDEKWGVNVDALIAKIRSWSYPQCLAVVDAIERFWVRCEESTVESVGLVQSAP